MIKKIILYIKYIKKDFTLMSFLYVIGNNTNRQKIGFSADVDRRLKTLQTGNPDKLNIHYFIECEDSKVRKLEKKLHKELSYKRLNGEWFNMTPKEAIEFLEFARIRWLDDNLTYF
jgi:predicted GIY-YIG superfamily endonuclease